MEGLSTTFPTPLDYNGVVYGSSPASRSASQHLKTTGLCGDLQSTAISAFLRHGQARQLVEEPRRMDSALHPNHEEDFHFPMGENYFSSPNLSYLSNLYPHQQANALHESHCGNFSSGFNQPQVPPTQQPTPVTEPSYVEEYSRERFNDVAATQFCNRNENYEPGLLPFNADTRQQKSIQDSTPFYSQGFPPSGGADSSHSPVYYYYHQQSLQDQHKQMQMYQHRQSFPPDLTTFSPADFFPPIQRRDTNFHLSGMNRSTHQDKSKSINLTNETDVEDVNNSYRCKNTVEGTKTSVRRFKKWYKEKYSKSIDMNAVNRELAIDLLKDFFVEIRDTRPGKEGNEYEPVTLTTYRNGLRRYFLERKVPPGPDNFDLADKEFDLVNFQLISKRNDLKRKGKGNHPNVVESITEEQLEEMWATGAIGIHAPRPLLRLQWWLNTVYHGIRGRMAHHDLSIHDFKISRGPDGKITIEYVKNVSKKRAREEEAAELTRNKKRARVKMESQDGSDRDPIRAFEIYLAHRPPGISSFYLTPKHKPKGDIWFNKVPMGKNSIGRIMREIKAIAGIS